MVRRSFILALLSRRVAKEEKGPNFAKVWEFEIFSNGPKKFASFGARRMV